MNILDQYDYVLPPGQIGLRPARPRDQARLLVTNREGRVIASDRFVHLPQYLPSRAVLVFNDTKVLPARLRVTKPTGGKADMLYLSHDRTTITALSDRRLDPGWTLEVSPTVRLRVVSHTGAQYRLQPSTSISTFLRLLQHDGRTPLPPYLRHSPLSERERRIMYQTVFARRPGSAAAPTASLHFTPRLMRALRRHGVKIEFVTLHVGLGTFAPVTTEHLRTKTLHHEHFEIAPGVASRLNKAKREGRPIIAVGTTVARTLESASRRGSLSRLQGETDLFIQPGYRWSVVDGLITNFHVPKSSLMMLVASLMGRQHLLDVYRDAIKKKFRFFSFGDGMLIQP